MVSIAVEWKKERKKKESERKLCITIFVKKFVKYLNDRICLSIMARERRKRERERKFSKFVTQAV